MKTNRPKRKPVVDKATLAKKLRSVKAKRILEDAVESKEKIEEQLTDQESLLDTIKSVLKNIVVKVKKWFKSLF